MGWSLLIGGIVATVAGVAGAFAQSQKNKEAKEQAQQQLDYIEEMYGLNKQRAEEEFLAAKEEAEKQRDQIYLQANLADEELNLSEKNLSSDFNAAIDNLYYAQEGDARSYNLQALEAGSSAGTAYANIAASGIRAGSSLSDAVELESAINEGQLQFAQDSKRNSINNSLTSVLNELAGQKFNIQQNRTLIDRQRLQAYDLVASYENGGHNYNLYQNQLESLKTTSDYNSAAVNYAIQQNTGVAGALKIGAAFLSSGNAGFQTGYSLADTAYKAGNYKNNYKSAGGSNGIG